MLFKFMHIWQHFTSGVSSPQCYIVSIPNPLLEGERNKKVRSTSLALSGPRIVGSNSRLALPMAMAQLSYYHFAAGMCVARRLCLYHIQSKQQDWDAALIFRQANGKWFIMATGIICSTLIVIHTLWLVVLSICEWSISQCFEPTSCLKPWNKHRLMCPSKAVPAGDMACSPWQAYVWKLYFPCGFAPCCMILPT